MDKKDLHILHRSQVNSTNDYLKDLFKCYMLVEETAVVADYQTDGKGQGENDWESEPGKNILLSIVYYPEFLEVSKQFYFSMMVSLGITDFLKGHLPEKEIFIKWPNDIYAGNEKIGGILIYNEIIGDHYEYAVAGTGINVNQQEFSPDIPNPTSMISHTGKEYNIMDLVHELILSLRRRYEQLQSLDLAGIKKEYHSKLLGINEWRKYEYKNERIDAMITGVNEFGHLKLETMSGSIECDMKEIVYLF